MEIKGISQNLRYIVEGLGLVEYILYIHFHGGGGGILFPQSKYLHSIISTTEVPKKIFILIRIIQRGFFFL